MVRHCQIAWSTVRHLPRQNRRRLRRSVTPALWTPLTHVWVKQASTHETEKDFCLHPRVQQPQAGPARTWSFGAAAGTWLTIRLRRRRPGSILLTCFLPASGDHSANTSKMPVGVSKRASKIHREGLGRGQLHLLLPSISDFAYPLAITPSYKHTTNLYKKKGYVCSFLFMEVFPPFAVFFLTLCILSEGHAHQHRKPEKNPESLLNQLGN